MKVARGTINFKAATRLRLSDTIVDASELNAQNPEAQTQPHELTQFINISSDSDMTTQASRSVISITDVAIGETSQRARKRKAHTLSEERSTENLKRTKRTSFARTKKGLNPTFKNPIAGYLKTRKTQTSSQDTPRSESAPGTTVLVPATENPKRQHDLSNTGRPQRDFDNLRSSSSPAPDCVDETSFINHLPDFIYPLDTRSHDEIESFTDNRHSGLHKYPGNQEQLFESNHRVPQRFVHESDISSSTFHTDFAETDINIGTEGVQFAREHPRTTPDATTATPSDGGRYVNVSSPLAQKGRRDHTSVVDLTFSPEEKILHVARRDVLGPVSSPILQQQEIAVHHHVVRARHSDLLNLPQKFMCNAAYTVKSRPFESFLPQNLLDLAEKFGLLDHFRPISAPASIRNNQRGYWNLRIKVTDVAVVAAARRSPLTASQWSDQRFMLRQEGLVSASASSEEGNDLLKKSVYPNRDTTTHVPWTINEFKTFWAYLGKTIERGQAGYDVFASLKRSEQTLEDVDIIVKLYGYAESLTHLWLVLYGVSSTLTASMPLQWCLPGTGPLITMSGQLKRGGTLGRWVPRQSGIHGSWGLEENWNGLSS